MGKGSLDSLFHPNRVAVVGAGTSPTNLGHMVVRNLVEGNFQGVVYPINPKHESIGGIQAYPSVLETPQPPDLAILCIPAKFDIGVVRQCGQRGTKGIINLAAGFKETGKAGRELEAQMAAEVAKYPGLRMLGPNCLGLQVPSLNLNASFASHMPSDGHIAFVSQSGALTAAAIEWAISKGIGFSKVVTLGNMMDVALSDVIDYLAEDDDTHSMVIYAESVTNPQAFTAAASRFTQKKPIVVYKAGRFAASAKAAVSHTGAMAGADSVYDAALRRVGATRVLRISDLYHTIELLDADRPAKKPSLAVVTNAGGPGVMSADALVARGGRLASLEQETVDSLSKVLPAAWSHGNPIDVLGDAPAKRYEAAIKAAVTDPDADAVLVILTPQAMTDIAGSADAVVAAARTTTKPILATWMGGGRLNDLAKEKLTSAGVPTFDFPEQAVDAFMNLVDYQLSAARREEEERAAEPEDTFTPDRELARQIIASVPPEGVLSELDGKRLFNAYGIHVALSKLARTREAAISTADATGYPVVLKIASPDITHKTDVGGVAIDLKNAQQVGEAYDRVIASAKAKRPDAEITGVTIQEWVEESETDQELILGANQDPTFGATIMVAAGGIAAEILKDKALELAPVDAPLIRRMLASLRIWPLLKGYRGRPGADLDNLVTIVERFSRLVVEHPEITEVEINPLLASSSKGAIAIDARAVVDRKRLENPPAPYSHLAIRPKRAAQGVK